MHIIIVGCGKVGSRFADIAIDEGHDVVIIDSDPRQFKKISNDFRGILLPGIPVDQDVLKQAGIEIADVLIAVTPDDNLNIMACQVAKEIFSVKRAIARIYSPERAKIYHERFSIETFCPTISTVEAMHSLMMGKEDVSKHMIGSTNFVFKHEVLGKKFEDKKLKNVIGNSKEFVFGVIQKEKFLFANPNIKLKAGDTIVYAKKADKEEI